MLHGPLMFKAASSKHSLMLCRAPVPLPGLTGRSTVEQVVPARHPLPSGHDTEHRPRLTNVAPAQIESLQYDPAPHRSPTSDVAENRGRQLAE